MDVKIEVINEGDRKVWGEYEHGQWIKLNPNQPNALFALDTVLHEIIHGLDKCASITHVDDDLESERIASALATGLTQVFKDNPTLLAWIGKALGSTSPGTTTSPSSSSWDGSVLALFAEPTTTSSRTS